MTFHVHNSHLTLDQHANLLHGRQRTNVELSHPHGNQHAVFFLSLSKTRCGNRLCRCVTAALLVGLAGCAAPLPKLTPPLPAQWQHAANLASAKPTDLHGWWHAFADPELDALVDRALTNNLQVAEAVQRLRAVRTLQRRSHARYLPALDARTSDVTDPDASASFLVAGFDATWELGLFGRATGSQRESQGTLNASVADLRSAQVSLVAEVVREWITLRTAQQLEQQLAQISRSKLQQQLALQTRHRLQLAAPDTVEQATAAYAQSLAALAAPRQSIVASAQQLALLLGQNHPDSAWLQPGTPPDLGVWSLDNAPIDILRTRPEIARAEADVLRAAGELATAHADRFPRVGLGASMVWATDINNNHERSTTPNGIASAGPMLNIPLFDWGIRRAAQNAKDHELQASVLAYRQAVLQGVTEVEVALGSLQQQQQREQNSRLAWQALQRAEHAVQTRVQLQLSSPLERATSQIATAQAAIELDESRAAHSLAYVALFKALGGAPRPSNTISGDGSPGATSPPRAESAVSGRR